MLLILTQNPILDILVIVLVTVHINYIILCIFGLT